MPQYTLNHKKTNYKLFIWFGLLFIYVLGALYFSYFWIDPVPEQYRLKQGQLLLSEATTPQSLNGIKETTVNFPDWDSPKKLNSTNHWYLIPLLYPSANTGQKLAIYLPRLSQNVEVFINNQWIGNGGSMEAPISRNHDHNLTFKFDRKIITPDQNNILAIHLVGELPDRSYLGDVYFGPEQAFKKHSNLSKRLHIDLIIIITLCLFFSSIFIGILWLLRKSDTHYLCYAIFSLLWVLHENSHFLKELPVNVTLWETASSMALGFSMLFVILFIHRYEGPYPKKTERIIILLVLIMALPFVWQELSWIMLYSRTIWSPVIAMIGVYGLYFVYNKYKNLRQDRQIPIMMGGCAIMIFGPHDLLLELRLIPKQSPYMMHFAALPVVVIIATTLITRFVQSMNVVEHYNQELQNEIHRKSKEMEANYQQMQTLMKKYTVAEERQRIMRDIHDGIGGQLVAILASLDFGNTKRKQLKRDIKHALQDLRLVVDSLDHESEDLPTLLGMLRMRLSEQLTNAQLKLHWRVGDLPRVDNFGPAKVLSTMRLIQEAITNAIKHSGANNLTISTELIACANGKKYACIIVNDDGCGIIPEESSGRGLLNMRKRAELIDGELYINAVKGVGVTVHLEIPILEE